VPKTPKHLSDLSREHVKYARAHRKPRTAADVARLYRSKILPGLGAGRRLDTLTAGAVERWHRAMSATPVEANRAAAVLKAGWNLAEMWGWLPAYSNPCRWLGRFRFPERPRSRVLTSEELRRWLDRLGELEHDPRTRTKALALKLILFEGMRRGEVEALRWDELELGPSAPALRLRDSKTGAKTIYLSDAGVAILERVPRTDSELVFAGEPLRRFHERLRRELQTPDVTRHDLRRTFATRLFAAGVETKAIADKLGQRTIRVTEEHYLHAEASERRRVANVGADSINAAR